MWGLEQDGWQYIRAEGPGEINEWAVEKPRAKLKFLCWRTQIVQQLLMNRGCDTVLPLEVSLYSRAWLGEVTFPFCWMFLRRFMLFTKGPCPCCASVPLPLLASPRLRLRHPFLYKETSARMIRWASSTGKCSADHWETKLARADCPFVQLSPPLRPPAAWAQDEVF